MFLGVEDTVLGRAPERRAEVLRALTCKQQRLSLLCLITNRNLKGHLADEGGDLPFSG